MTQQILRFLKNYSVDIHKINRLIVSTYIYVNKIDIINNHLINSLLITKSGHEESQSLSKFIDIVTKSTKELTIENIIRLFEFVISPVDKEVNGAVYTPIHIRDYITKISLSRFEVAHWSDLKIADISCGCGGFFLTAVKQIKERIDISYYNLYQNLFGVDIESYSIERTKILLSLYAIENGEDVDEFTFNFYVDNSLSFDWNVNDSYRNNQGFDVIIGNPPYVGSSKIAQENKELLDRWSVCSTGKPDLYIPFFQIAIELLNQNGVLGYITVSNFYRSLNGRAFRSYMSENFYSLKMIDFGSEQIFKGRSTYTCICHITKNRGGINYIKTTSANINDILETDFIRLQYDTLSNLNGWLLQDSDIAQNIIKIENTGIALGQYCQIRNGFATLRNDVYILNVIKTDNTYYHTKSKTGNIYKIERNICRDVIKPNTLKYESEIIDRTEKLIFPYISIEGGIKIINESEFKTEYPYAYRYLLANKKTLAERDKGNRDYEEWYAYGRNQALNICGNKLLFPYIANYPHFVLTDQQNLLFYNGYAIVSSNMQKIIILQKILRSKIFWYYIKHTSKPYGSEYYALAKNYIKNFGVVNLTQKQEVKLLSLNDNDKIDSFIAKLYNVSID